MKQSLAYFLLVTFVFTSFSACQSELHENLDLSDIDLSGLSDGMFTNTLLLDVSDLSKKEIDQELEQLTKEFMSEVYQEIQKGAIPDDHKYVVSFEINNNQIILLQSTVTENPYSEKWKFAYQNRSDDGAPNLVGSCGEGWDKVGSCLTESCVQANVQLAFSAVADGGCKRVEVSVGRFGATVCEQDC